MPKHILLKQKRSGTAVSELAVCLPVVVIIIFAAIQGAELMFLKQSLSISAYEGCRHALLADGSQAKAKAAAEIVLQDRSVTGAAVTFTPDPIANVKVGGYISITVTAPVSENSTLQGWMFAPDTVSSSVTMMKEFGDFDASQVEF